MEEPKESGDAAGYFKRRPACTACIFFVINLLNYMDRYAIAGVLTQIQCDFGIDDGQGSLLLTVFVVVFVIWAPIIGYLGDRYSRRLIMAIGVFLWSLFALLGSFMVSYEPFLAMRALVGIGEASYAPIIPGIISDVSIGDKRSVLLASFFFATPVGSGLGYVVASEMARTSGSWQWGLRVTPIFGFVAVLLVLLAVPDPPRGHSEGVDLTSSTSWWEDIKSLAHNKSFVLSTIGATAAAFVLGGAAWWVPKFLTFGLSFQEGPPVYSAQEIALIIRLIGMLTGLIGIPLGSFLAQKFRLQLHFQQQADPLLCGSALSLSVPLILATLFLADVNVAACFILISLGTLLVNFNWAVSTDILLYTVLPTRRTTAMAVQVLLMRSLGDTGSPYLVGQVSQWIKGTYPPSNAPLLGRNVPLVNTTNVTVLLTGSVTGNYSGNMMDSMNCTIPRNTLNDYESSFNADNFHSLQYALILPVVVELLGAFFFFATAWYVVEDKAKVDRQATSVEPPGGVNESSSSVASAQTLEDLGVFNGELTVFHPSVELAHLENDELPGSIAATSSSE